MNLVNTHDTRIRLNINTPEVTIAGISDRGYIRTDNEDKIWADESGRIVLLADGMGGHERGADASRIAVEVFSRELGREMAEHQLKDNAYHEDDNGYPPTYNTISRAVCSAANIMCEENRQLRLLRYMGTTIVGLILSGDNRIFWFHIGDSRLYRWRDSVLKRLTLDHSAYTEWKAGGSFGPAPAKNLVTRAIGNNPYVEADIEWEERKKGDVYVLCSDGLTDMISDDKITELLTKQNNTTDMVDLLVNEALASGGRDNVSIIACKIL